MRTTKYILFGALGVAAVLLLTSGRARKVREDLENKAKENATKWKGKLWNIGGSANKTLSELRDLLNSKVEGLSEDARAKIEAILSKTASSADGHKKNISNQLI